VVVVGVPPPAETRETMKEVVRRDKVLMSFIWLIQM
jgi:hypothetical protein